VYSRKPLVLLDDIFSGLDPITEEIIFRSLLGHGGILRRESQTVVLVTHAVHLLSTADIVILLGGNSDVVYQGQYSNFPMELISTRDLDRSTKPASSKEATTTHRVELFDPEEFVPTFHPAFTELDIVAPDTSRQMGDSKVYKYYLKTTGLKHTLFFVFLGAICMGFTPAQSMNPTTFMYNFP
jgi:ATP-binding cassette subfamily C (CFTR/MRP) protein 1